MNEEDKKRVDFPNILLVAGNGRNVGKTWLACRIIKKLSQNQNVIAIKISSHYHPEDADEIFIQNERFIISSETKNNSKDSSLMLQAGAEKVYFIMAPQQFLQEAFNDLKSKLADKLVVCESGGLIEYINPGIFLFVNRKGKPVQKTHLLKYSPTVIENDGQNINFDLDRITITDNKFIMK